MQNFFRIFARVAYYVYSLLLVGLIALFIWILFMPLKGPGSEFLAMAIWFYFPVMCGILIVALILYYILQKLTKPQGQPHPVANVVITLVFFVLLTLSLCALFVSYLG